MDDSQKLTEIVCSVHRSIMKHLRTRREIYGLIFHRSRVAAARRVDSPSVGRDLKRQRQDRVVTVAGRIYQIGHGKKDMKPHPLATYGGSPLPVGEGSEWPRLFMIFFLYHQEINDVRWEQF